MTLLEATKTAKTICLVAGAAAGSLSVLPGFMNVAAELLQRQPLLSGPQVFYATALTTYTAVTCTFFAGYHYVNERKLSLTHHTAKPA
jgi:hypothetical protein